MVGGSIGAPWRASRAAGGHTPDLFSGRHKTLPPTTDQATRFNVPRRSWSSRSLRSIGLCLPARRGWRELPDPRKPESDDLSGKAHHLVCGGRGDDELVAEKVQQPRLDERIN